MKKTIFCCLIFLTQTLLAKDYGPCLVNTTWIVPPQTLLAYDYNNGTTTAVDDQTVWVIDSYNGGYFFGTSYTALDTIPLSQKNLVGSITSSGDVYITFYPLDSSSPVTGIGKFKKKNSQRYFVMQMTDTGSSTSGLSHWSYMISVTPNDPFYQSLPGVGLSVPDFISQF